MLVDQATEPVDSLWTSPALLNVRRIVQATGTSRSMSAVRSLIVVMLDELPQYPIEMSLTSDEEPVDALGPGCPHEPFGGHVRPRRSHGSPDDPGASRPHHLVEGTDEPGVRSRTSNRTALLWSSSVIAQILSLHPTGRRDGRSI